MARRRKLISHDSVQLRPRTVFDGPTLEFNFPDMTVGIAEYEEGPTGCTVFHFPKGISTAVDIRGGSVGASETGYGWYHAICFAGGSLFGLEAALGVRAELLSMQNYSINWENIPLVSGAIIWDWRGRNNAIYPDTQLGRAALRAARAGVFPLGARGAGRSANVGGGSGLGVRDSSGQGAAYRQIGRTRIAVFTVVNALGAIVNRKGQVVRGNRDPGTGNRLHIRDRVHRRSGESTRRNPSRENTTLTLVVTNRKLDAGSLHQLAKQVHSSMSQAIQPFHTQYDGDILYAVTTNEVATKTLDELDIGFMASELAWDAVLTSFADG